MVPISQTEKKTLKGLDDAASEIKLPLESSHQPTLLTRDAGPDNLAAAAAWR
jgi:hypothetical protein